MTRPTAIGRLHYDPTGAGRPEPWWLILRCDGDWFRKLERDIRGKMPRTWKLVSDPARNVGKQVDPPHLAAVGKIVPPNWGCHITVLRGDEPSKNKHLWGKDEGYTIEFEYDPDPRYNNEYIWYDVWSEEILQMREAYGFDRNLRGRSRDALHLTVARWEGVWPNIPWGEDRRFR